MTRPLIALLVVVSATGCRAPNHLQYDFGRATMEAYNTQQDLTRPSVAETQHALTGNEAAAIRLNQRTSATDQESGDSELTQGTD